MRFTCVPSGNMASIASRAAHERLRDAMKDVSRVLEASVGPLPLELREALDSICGESRLSPNVYAVESGIRRALATRDRQELIRLLKVICRLRHEVLPNRMTIRSFGNGEADTRVASFVASLPYSARKREEILMEPVPESRFAACRKNVNAALALIGQLDPELLAEVQEHVQYICVFDGEGVLGVSTPKAFGSIYIRRTSGELPLPYYVEHVVHEAAHTHLNALLCLAPLVLNPNGELYSSPLRSDLRPMHGILHATFVLWRVLHVFDRWVEEARDAPICDRVGELRVKFNEGVEVIKRYGRLTAAGKEFFASLRESEWKGLNESCRGPMDN